MLDIICFRFINGMASPKGRRIESAYTEDFVALSGINDRSVLELCNSEQKLIPEADR